MTTRSKFLSWSKKGRQSTSEPYHRTGGLLPIAIIDVDSGASLDASEELPANDIKSTVGPGRQRPPDLTIVPPDCKSNERTFFSPASAQQYARLSRSASNLLAVVDDMLRSPAPGATTCSKTSAPLHKPLPSRPRSLSLPSTPEPVELPGSLLLQNEGYLSPSPVAGSTPSTMRSARSGNPIRSSTSARSIPPHVPQRRLLDEAGLKRRSRSRPNLLTTQSAESTVTKCSLSTENGDQTSSASSSRARVGAEQLLPLVVDGKASRRSSGGSSVHAVELGTSATPTPTSTRSTRVEELKATITAQDQTISTLQAQFASLRASHEAHVASLVETHSAEVTSLKNYTKVLEDQQSQRTLHHASSNHLLFLLDTTDQPQSPTRETPQLTAGASASSIRSFGSALEQQTRASSERSHDSPEMDSLKRKLSAARRPDANSGDTIRELNMYKKSCEALQRQIDLLMVKLNDSQAADREKQNKLDDARAKLEEYEKNASKVAHGEKSTSALQNTVDHLEYRLQMANIEKVELEEHLWHLQRMRHIFDPKSPSTLPLPPVDRQSMSTIFANDSPINESDPSDPKSVNAFLDRIECLNQQLRTKDKAMAATDVELDGLRRTIDGLEDEARDLRLQLDIQTQLLAKTKKDEIHMHELRTTIMQREKVIGDRNGELSTLKTQLDHHKQLLQAGVKRQAMYKLYGEVQDDLPDLNTLASKYDIDRWIEGLKSRLKQYKAKTAGLHSVDSPKTTIEELREEIDFYVSEIIYFKLDCRGYKLDIKKLKKTVQQMSSQSSGTNDVDSPDLSGYKPINGPADVQVQAGASGLGISASPSSVSTGRISINPSVDRPTTPSNTTVQEPVRADGANSSPKRPKKLNLRVSTVPRTPTRQKGTNTANQADNVDPGISPRSVARLSPERRKPTPPSPDQEKFGKLATNFPLGTPASPKRHESRRILHDVEHSRPKTPERLPPSNGLENGRLQLSPSAAKGKLTPERPPRPRVGLFESPVGMQATVSVPLTPPRMDVMAEAMRNSPEHAQQSPRRKLTIPSASSDPVPNSISRSGESPISSAVPLPLVFRSREGSLASNNANLPTTASSSPPRRPSDPPGLNVPFVIAMGSPHNPALVAPTASVPQPTCSITRNTAVTLARSTSRTGVGGTMASTTPVTSPPPSRNASTSSKTKPETQTSPYATSSFAAPTVASRSRTTSPAHSRNVSGSSIRMAITSNVQARMDFMKGKGKARKESISHPTPLASPFDIDRSTPDGERRRGGDGELV